MEKLYNYALNNYFKTEEHTISIGDYSFHLRSVTNFDELYEQLLAQGLPPEDVADEGIPYWAELWPSAVGLATHLVTYPHLVRGKTVLEIGGGLGLPAIAAAALGAETTATDYLQDAVDFAQSNAEINGIQNMRFETLDWRKAGGYGQCDVLLASDVAYERSQFDHLESAFTQLIKTGGLILMSEPDRYIAAPFWKKLEITGYFLDKCTYQVEVKGIKSNVSVYAIMRKAVQ